MADKEKVLFLISAENYEPTEYEVPKKIIEEAGYEVVTASDKPGTARTKDGKTAKVDMTINDIYPGDYTAMIIVGGSGCMEHLDNETVYSILREANNLELSIGAICHGTRILAKANLLNGRRATGYNGDGKLPEIYKHWGVIYVPVDVVKDENFVTATNPAAAEEFGNQMVALIKMHKDW